MLSGLASGAMAAPVLGQRVDLSRGAARALASLGVCRPLSCRDVVSARIDTHTLYVGALDEGAFTYVVDGRVAMVGWMGRPHGESPLTPSPAQWNLVSRMVTGQDMPGAWRQATWTNWDGSPGLDPDKLQRVQQGAFVSGAKTGAWMTVYAVQAAHEVRLRGLINRAERSNARAVALRFIRQHTGPLAAEGRGCEASSLPLMAAGRLDDAASRRFAAYFKTLAMPATGCCGAPATFTLPGLSASSVFIETRARDSSGMTPNACVGVGGPG